MELQNVRQFDLHALRRNFHGLEASLRKLSRAYKKELSSHVYEKATHTISYVNSVLTKCNHWAQDQLRKHQDVKQEQKELEHQISNMEGEGNVTCGTPVVH